jgi:hypothetical protein
MVCSAELGRQWYNHGVPSPAGCVVPGFLMLGIHELGDLHIHFINMVEEVLDV